jgi:hypothetical protein
MKRWHERESSTSYPSPHSWSASLPPVQFEMAKQRSSCVELGSRHQSASNGSVATVTPTSVQFVPIAWQGTQPSSSM